MRDGCRSQGDPSTAKTQNKISIHSHLPFPLTLNHSTSIFRTPSVQSRGSTQKVLWRYYREVRHPEPGEIHLIDYASRIAGIAIERHRAQTAVTSAFEKIKKSEAELQQIVDAIPQAITVLNP